MKGEWTRVEDALPEIGQYVLVWPGARLAVRCRNIKDWDENETGWHWEGDGEGLRIRSRLTHWHWIHGPEGDEEEVITYSQQTCRVCETEFLRVDGKCPTCFPPTTLWNGAPMPEERG